MKRIYGILTAFLAAAAFMAVSCEKDSGKTGLPEPVFPDLVENYNVKPGETLELTFTPNNDWKVSVPADARQWFWIKDGSFNVTELQGKASQTPVTVKIGVTEIQEFDRNNSCEVSLTMAEKTQVIAKYMLPAKERTLEVYSAERAEDGSFKTDGSSYVYGIAPTGRVELVWSASDEDFRAPVKVEANCEWDVELPEWADVNVPENTTGVVQIVFTGESVTGGEGKLVFKAGGIVLKELAVTIPSCGDIDVYTAVLSDGEFEYGGEGEYLWTENPVSAVDVAWLGNDFRMPLKVDSKCSWSLELPVWLSAEVPEKTAGTVAFTLLGVPSEYPLEGAEDNIVFKNGDSVLKKMKVTIPPCQDIMTFAIDMSLTALEYNYKGEVNTTSGFVSGPATGSLSGVQAVRVFAVETTGSKVGAENPDWFKVELSSWNTAAGADVIQTRTLTFSVTENKGEARSAVLFVLPPSVKTEVSDLFNADSSVKSEYEGYSVQVTQASMHYDDYITIRQSDDAEFTHTFERADARKAEELTTVFGETGHVYVLTYESQYSRDDAFMTMAVPFTSFKVFGTADASDERTSDPDFWLSYTNGSDASNYGVVDMYKDRNLPTEPSVGYVVFYGSEGDVLAIVECVSPYVAPVLEVDKEEFVFASDASTHSLAVTSNMDWTAVSSEMWCTVSPASGYGDATVVISVSENATSEVRTAVVTIRSSAFTRTVSVEQKFGEVLEVGSEALEFGFFSSSETLAVTSNVAWTIESGADWCTVTPASGSGNSEVTVTVKKNAETVARSTILTLKSESQTKTVTVTQKGDDGTQTTDLQDEYGNVFDIVDSYFTDAASAKAAGANIYQCKSGPYYDQYKEFGCPILILEYESADTAVEIVLPAQVSFWYTYPITYSDFVSVNNETIYDTSGIMAQTTDKVTVRMTKELYEMREEIEADGGKNSGFKLTFHKNMSTQDPTAVVFLRLDLGE